MKFTLAKIGLFLIALVLFNTAQAKIWRLNNNGNNPTPAIVADFTGTLQAAHDDASVKSGDTIHIEQSPTTYGNCTFNKRLVIIGSGYFLNKNPKTQVVVDYNSTVGDLTFYNINAAGSHIFGLTTGNVFMGVNNLLIARCNLTAMVYIGNNSTGDLEDMTITQCYLSVIINNNQPVVRNNSGTGQVAKLDIINNIFANPGYAYSIILDAKVSGRLKNNLFNSIHGLNIQNFYVLNNIGINSNSYTFKNCIVEYNTGTAAGMFVSPAGTNTPSGAGNQTKTIGLIALLGGPSPDNSYSLASGSECKGAGKDGADCGAFGGDYPYKLSGIAPVPNIYDVVIAPISAGATNISVTVSAKGNN